MKCAVCHLGINIYEFDLGTAVEAINPITFRKASMHTDCLQDAIETAQQTESKDPVKYQNRYDEYLTKHN